MDGTELLLVMFGFIFFVLLAFFAGRSRDMIWRAKFCRNYLKQKVLLIERVSKDLKTRTLHIINTQTDVINLDGKMWVVDKDRIYRKNKQEQGTVLSAAKVKYEEGVPIITLDDDSIKPLDYFPEQSSVKPAQLGATLSSWVINQIAKNAAQLKNSDLWMKIAAICAAASVLIAGGAFMKASETYDLVKGGAAAQPTPQLPKGGSVNANGTIVIKGPGT
jgi:hypothetical protein